MGIRSDVGIAIKTHVLNDMSDSTISFLENESGETYTTSAGRLFIIRNVKWYVNHDQEINSLYNELYKFDDSDYFIIDACHDFPENTDGDAGNWYDNPFGLCKETAVNLRYNG